MKYLAHILTVLLTVLGLGLLSGTAAAGDPVSPDPTTAADSDSDTTKDGPGGTAGQPAPGSGTGTGDSSAPAGVSVPRVMLKAFGTDPAVIVAGQDFEVNFTLQNTSMSRRVSNLKVTLASGDGAFLPASGSSSIYLEGISSGDVSLHTMTFHSLPSMEEKSYQMTLTVEYEDKDANAFTSTETVAVQVTQDVRASASEPVLSPAALAPGQDASLTFSINNQGKSKLYNARAVVPEGQSVTAPEVFVGTIEPGASGAVDMTLRAETEQSGPVTIQVFFENAVGKVTTVTKEVEVIVQPPMDTPTEPEAYPEEAASPFGWVLSAVLVAAAVVVLAIVLLVRRSRRRRAEQEDLQSLAMFDGEPLLPTDEK